MTVTFPTIQHSGVTRILASQMDTLNYLLGETENRGSFGGQPGTLDSSWAKSRGKTQAAAITRTLPAPRNGCSAFNSSWGLFLQCYLDNLIFCPRFQGCPKTPFKPDAVLSDISKLAKHLAELIRPPYEMQYSVTPAEWLCRHFLVKSPFAGVRSLI